MGEAADRQQRAIDDIARETEKYANAAGTAAQETKNWMGALDLNLLSSIQTAMDKIDFKQAGGAELQEAFDLVFAAVDDNRITPEQGEEMLNGLYVAAAGLETELGNMDLYEAARAIQEQLGVPFAEALELVKNFKTEALFDNQAFSILI